MTAAFARYRAWRRGLLPDHLPSWGEMFASLAEEVREPPPAGGCVLLAALRRRKGGG